MAESWKKVLQRGRVYLCNNLVVRDGEMWAHLISNEILTEVQVDNIKANTGNHAQVSALIDHLTKRPASDFEKFLNILAESNNDHVAQYLNTEVTNAPHPVARYRYVPPNQRVPEASPGGQPPPYTSIQQGHHDATPTGINAMATGLSNLEFEPVNPAPPHEILKITVQLKKVQCTKKMPDHTNIQTMKEIYKRGTEKNSEQKCYEMESGTRGLGIIITMTGDRKGWQNDVLKLEEMFIYLNIHTEYHFDLSSKEMEEKLVAFAGNKMVQAVDCLFVVIMGHGGVWNNIEYMRTADRKGVFDVKEKMKEIFSNHRFPHLIDKPKVFMVQMCRGSGKNKMLTHAGEYKKKTQTDAMTERHVGAFTDYIYGFATQSGTVSYRGEGEGSWYIQHVADTFMEKAHTLSVEQMLSKVNAQLEVTAARKEEGAQIGERVSSLKHELYLFPGVDLPMKHHK